MTRNRSSKKTNRNLAAEAGISYTEARMRRGRRHAAPGGDEPDTDVALHYGDSELGRRLHDTFDKQGLEGLLILIAELRESLWERDHYFTTGCVADVLHAVRQVCQPLLYRTPLPRAEGEPTVWTEPLLDEPQRARVHAAYRLLEEREAHVHRYW
ncbi:hypothetical protein [Streptomyces sp. NPDC058657]|uniref:hypothetical protein n=1 Tax=unclassified Streptomyces TaxID=2593676 RepID=UPI003651B572